MKQCSKCKEEKSFDNFHKKKDSLDGYRNICKMCRKGEHTQRYEDNKETYNKRAIEWRKTNPEKVKTTQKKYREANKQKRSEYLKTWVEHNRGRVNAYNATRHAAKKLRTPSWLTDFDKLKIECLYQLAAMYSRESDVVWHVDHIVPLQGDNVCGLHVPWNLRVVTASENLRKYNKHE